MIAEHLPYGSRFLSSSTKTPVDVPTVPPRDAFDVVPIPSADLKITIVYDNNHYDSRLTAAWGFAAVIEYVDHTILFDTGGHGQTLLENMAIAKIDPTRIEAVILSHYHDDHTGGLYSLLERGATPTVYLLSCFPSYFKDHVRHTTTVIETVPGQSISDGASTTGEVDTNSIREQALVLKTDRGLVVMAGCAHPGIVHMVKRAKILFESPIHLVIGGFHLRSKSDDELKAILYEFRQLGVETVAPCHCTGDRAIEMFKREYGTNFIQAGIGRVIEFEP
jgi:7,8-dihydropterin-6-yl-methyl-4-(beta-D-ribofuranosyl)aminobenzene 5'-phosphate synthase